MEGTRRFSMLQIRFFHTHNGSPVWTMKCLERNGGCDTITHLYSCIVFTSKHQAKKFSDVVMIWNTKFSPVLYGSRLGILFINAIVAMHYKWFLTSNNRPHCLANLKIYKATVFPSVLISISVCVSRAICARAIRWTHLQYAEHLCTRVQRITDIPST